MTPAEMMALWETGRELSLLDRGVIAAQAARRGTEGDAADWPLGERNRALAQLHCELFGGQLLGFTRCVACGEQLEFTFEARRVAEVETQPAEQKIAVGKWVFRMLTSRMLAAAAEENDEAAATRRLLSACLAEPVSEEASWTDADVEAIEERLAEADPLAEILMHFDCPICGTEFDESLDLSSFVWSVIERSATHVLEEVHVLATAYGWSEREILTLSAARREAYIEMVLR
jgi:hypothetical protein